MELADVVRLAVETARPALDAAGLALEVKGPAEPIALHADPTRLDQMFANLLNNAAKFSERGGRVTVAVARRGGEAQVCVHDRGVGIPAPMLERIFDLFTQVDTWLEKDHGGLGIGLTLVKHLVELHGGQVEARSDGPGRGSELVVWLPLAEAAASTRRAGLATRRAPPGRDILASCRYRLTN